MSKPIQLRGTRKGGQGTVLSSERQSPPSTRESNIDDADRDAILREIQEGAAQTDAYGKTLERALHVTEKDLRTQVSI